MSEKHLFVRTADVVCKGLWRLFPAINVDKVADIPKDYPGPIGVPITFMGKYVDTQFALLGYTKKGIVKGRHVFDRLLIRNLEPALPEYIDLVAWFAKMGVPLEIVLLTDTAAPPTGPGETGDKKFKKTLDFVLGMGYT